MAKAAGIDMQRWNEAICRMMAGKAETSPFSDEEKCKARAFLDDWCRERGQVSGQKLGDIVHTLPYPDLRLLQSFLFARSIAYFLINVFTSYLSC